MSEPTSSKFDTEAQTPSGTAICGISVDTDAFESEDAPYTVHGVAIGADEFTLGGGGPKFWPADEIKAATESIINVPLNVNHDDDTVDSVVGEVVDAGFEPDTGIVFEAEVDDASLATQIARGRLDVSIHALHSNDGRLGTEVAPDAVEDLPPGLEIAHTPDAIVATDIEFLDLAVVPRGGAPSNQIDAGASPSEALASLSPKQAVAILNDSPMTDEPTDSDAESLDDAECTDSVEEEYEAEVEATEGEDAPDEADVEADEESVASDETGIDADELDAVALKAENEMLRSELQSVRMEYAGQLCESTPFEAEELASNFTFEQLKEKFEATEASLVSDTTTQSETGGSPAPRTGDDGGAELEASSEDTTDEIAELEGKVEAYDEMGWDAARREAESKLAELQD